MERDLFQRAEEVSVERWKLVPRARSPYRFRPIGITTGPRQEGPAREPGEYFYMGAIGDRLLRLNPPEVEEFYTFVLGFGLLELATWAADSGLGTWETIERDLLDGKTAFSRSRLSRAWRDTRTVEKFSLQRCHLEMAYLEVQQLSSWQEATTTVLDMGWAVEAFKIHLEPHPTTGQIVERPKQIFARAWFDLLDAVGERKVAPRPCLNCGFLYTPRRLDQKYCELSCQQRGGEIRRALNPRRREYKTMWQRLNRGTITRADFDAWVDAHPHTDQRGG